MRSECREGQRSQPPSPWGPAGRLQVLTFSGVVSGGPCSSIAIPLSLLTGVAPFSGATTGTGGRIRDVQCTGRGAHVVAGTAGYCFGNLHIPGLISLLSTQIPPPARHWTLLSPKLSSHHRHLFLGEKALE